MRSSAFESVRALLRLDSSTSSGSSDSISSISELTGWTKFSGLVTKRDTFISAMSSSSLRIRLMDWTNPLTRACMTWTAFLRLRMTARASSGRSCLPLSLLPMMRFWTYLSPRSWSSSVSSASISKTVERQALTQSNSKVRSFCWSMSSIRDQSSSSSDSFSGKAGSSERGCSSGRFPCSLPHSSRTPLSTSLVVVILQSLFIAVLSSTSSS
mmetsp:Transcript_12936/g.36457  ORF Transcript_12936/g.36457 Transcript_12936/m.36457 type:complete len:212 (-) Transcript_12936:1223-1858(-)